MNCLYLSLVALSIFVLLSMSITYYLIKQGMGSRHRRSQPNFHDLDIRLKAYAKLKGALASETEHEVLLGTLKKIEAKNVGLTTFWIFLITSILLVATSGDFLEIFWLRPLLLTSAFLTIPFLISSIQGLKQLDQISTNKAIEAEKSLCSCDKIDRIAKQMQEDLKTDLLKKETAYRFSYCGAVCATFTLMLLFATAAIYVILI